MWLRDTQKQGPRCKPAPPEWMDLYYSGGVGPGVPLGQRRGAAENSDRVQLRGNITRAQKFPKKCYLWCGMQWLVSWFSLLVGTVGTFVGTHIKTVGTVGTVFLKVKIILLILSVPTVPTVFI